MTTLTSLIAIVVVFLLVVILGIQFQIRQISRKIDKDIIELLSQQIK